MLGPGRLWTGVAQLLLAALTKPIAIALGLPLVLGWAVVDRRSFLRLASTLALAGALTVGILELATRGGFLQALLVWRVHPIEPGALPAHTLEFARATLPALLLWIAVLAAAQLRGNHPARDSSVLLVLGGIALAPAMAKHGALWNYLLPAFAGMAVMTGRLADDPGGRAANGAIVPLVTAGGRGRASF